MKATQANATFISNVYSQESTEADWIKYKLTMTNGATPVALRPAHCSSTNLSIIDNKTNIVQGSTLYISTDSGNTIKSGTVGAVTTGNITLVSNTTATTATPGGNLGPSFTGVSVAGPPPCKANFDGSLIWLVDCTGSYNLIEHTCTTPGNLTTLVATGKTIGNFGYVGFDFGDSGRFLYKMDPINGYTIIRYTLAVPWDITTILPALTQTKVLVTGNPTITNVRCLRISEDGTKMMLMNSNSTSIFMYTLNIPWDIESIVGSTYSFTAALGTIGSGLDVTSDGKTWYYFSTRNSNLTHTLVAGVAATAWDPRTVGGAVSIVYTDDTTNTYGPYSYSISYIPTPIITGNGKYLMAKSAPYLSTSYNTKLPLLPIPGTDAGLSNNVDISSFGLSQTPTHAWIKEPDIKVTTANSLARTISSTTQLHLVNATTSTANVGSSLSGLISVGDTVLLNKTTPVVVSQVTETANGLSAQDIGLASDYVLSTGVRTYNSGVVPTNSGLRFSSDGRYMYVLGTTANITIAIHQYQLTEPWDISTAVYLRYLKVLNNTLFYPSTTNIAAGFDINPDGSSLFIFYKDSSATAVLRQYNMATKHNLNTCQFVADLSVPSSSSVTVCSFKFNNTGTMFEFVSTANNVYGAVFGTMSTPYTISTASVGTHINTYYGGKDRCFSADGTKIYTLNADFLNQNVTNINSNSVSPAHVFSTSNLPISTSTAAGDIVNFPDGVVANSTNSVGIRCSFDGQWFYVITNTGLIYQYGVRTKTMNNYQITFPTQASAPSSLYLPDKSVLQTLTPTYSNGKLNFTGQEIGSTCRNIQFKITNNQLGSSIDSVKIDVWRT